MLSLAWLWMRRVAEREQIDPEVLEWAGKTGVAEAQRDLLAIKFEDCQNERDRYEAALREIASLRYSSSMEDIGRCFDIASAALGDE
jgi:hypothetical protein